MSPMNNRRMTPMAEPGILDFAPGAAAAYSLRNLSLSYSGPVVTVRRSTDNAEADFTASEVSDGTLAGWAGADGFVKQWWDQSGNARHATQATTTAQPQIVDSGVLVTEGGKAAISFDGVDDYLLTANIGAFQASAGVGLFAVFSKDIASTSDTFTTTNPQYLASVLNSLGSTVDAKILWRILGGRVDYVRRNAANSAYITTRAESHAVAASRYMQSVVGGLAADLYLDGAELVLSDDQSGESFSSATSYIYIGSQDGSFRFLDGAISELIIYPTDQTALRQRIEGNLAWTYNA